MESVVLKTAASEDFFTQEAYKALRTNLQFCGQDVRVVAITSCNENEGKSTVSLNLAKSMAELGHSVLLIDADMRKSVMAGRNFQAKNVVGLSEVLTGMVTLGDGIYATQFESLHVMFAGKYPPNPVELLNGKYFAALLTEARKYYDYIIIDTPPLGVVIDAAVIAPNCNGVVLVMGEGTTRTRQAQEVLTQLEKSGCKILGAVRNGARRKGRYYKGYYKASK